MYLKKIEHPQSVIAKPYAYVCVDKSALTRWLSRTVAPAVNPLVPAVLTANGVTLTASAMIATLVAGLLLVPAGVGSALAPLWVALLWGYCVLDHVDGFRARSRGASSPWGEFLDHGLDALVVPAVVLAAVLMGPDGLVRPWLGTLLMAGAVLVTVAVWTEQRAVGVLYLPRFGPVEAVFATGLYMLSWLSPVAANWWAVPVLFGFSGTEVFLLVSLAIMPAGLIGFAFRAPSALGPVYAFAAMGAVTVAVAAILPSLAAPVALAFALAGAAQTARTILAHLTGAASPPVGILTVVATLAAAVLSPLLGLGPALAYAVALALGVLELTRAWLVAVAVLRRGSAAGTATGRSEVWLNIWRRKAASTDVPLHHVNGYDLLDQAGWDGMIGELVAKLRLRPGMEVIEFGCGAGAFPASMAKVCPGLKLHGIDYAPELVERVRRVLDGGFQVGDIRDCPQVPSGSYDLVCSFGTLMYLNSAADATLALDEMRRALRPEGEIYLGEISDAERRAEAERLRSVTHADHRRVSADRPDHLYLPRDFFTDYAARHGFAISVHDHRDLGFGAGNPLASYRYSIIMRRGVAY